MTTNEIKTINELPEIETVADLVAYLQTMPQHLPVVKANMEGLGYNKITPTDPATFALQIAHPDNQYVDFIDWDTTSNSFEAVVL